MGNLEQRFKQSKMLTFNSNEEAELYLRQAIVVSLVIHKLIICKAFSCVII